MKMNTLCWSGSIIAVNLLLSTPLMAEQNHLPILQYHHVGESTPFSTSVTPAQLQEHMDYLTAEGFQVIDLLTGLNKIQAGEGLPDKAVAITFDDAYRDIYVAGFPILKEKGFPFTIFINSQPIVQNNRHFLNWQEMREMQAAGAVMANHTISHPYMLRKNIDETDGQWLSRMQSEIFEVEALLQQHLGSTPKMLAYPYGESNEDIRQLVRDAGMIAFGQQSGVVSIDADFTNLPRFPASGVYAKLSALKNKLNAMPMPLVDVQTAAGFADETPVDMTLTFKEGNYRLKDLTCYVAGQGQGELTWLNKQAVKVAASEAFNYGRGRINCTMPATKGNRYHWFSHVWIRPRADQGYVGTKTTNN